MSAALAAEIERLNPHLYRMTRQSELVQEAPRRIHEWGTDDGHGLGAPPFSEEFIRWVGQVCWCGRKKDPFDVDDHGCSAAPTRVFFGSDHRKSPTRLKRALRKLRALAPAEYDAIYLMVALSYSFHAAMDKINDGRLTRGQSEYSETDFLVLSVAGAAKLVEAY